MRLSDGKSFIDCPLSGPYSLTNGQIVSEELYQNKRQIKKCDIVHIDYFSKINKDKMCHLQLIVRKIEPVQSNSPSTNNQIIGSP